MTSAARSRVSVGVISIGLLAAGASIGQAYGPAANAAKHPLTSSTRVGADRAGSVRIGMTVGQAKKVTGQRFVTLRGQPAPKTSVGCSYVRAVGGPRGLTFMLNGTRIVRVDVDAPNKKTATTRSIHRGDSENAVMRAYPGRITVKPNKYLPAGHDLVYKPASAALARYRIVFQTDGRKVGAILAGRLPQVNLVERCG